MLSVLALGVDRVCSADRLADALWGDAQPATAHKVVQGCISRLRTVLGPAAIATEQSGYRLRLARTAIDSVRFERLVVRARELLDLGESERAAFAAEEASGLWYGRAFAELEDWEPAVIESARLQELRLQAQELAVDGRLASGDAERCVDVAQRLAEAEPLREHRWVQLALAEYRSGRQTDALESLRRCRSILVEELGLDASTAVTDLEKRILRHDVILDLAVGTPPSLSCPWPGLASYGVEDSEVFCGREAALTSALALLRTRGVLVIAGPSGAGKSSLLRAGVMGQLQRDGAQVRLVLPADPIGDLSAGEVLVVDQFEEIFTLELTDHVRSEWLASVVNHRRRGPVAIALRADRMAEVAVEPTLVGLVEQGLFLLGPMAESELRGAIARPAAQSGLRLESGLVDLLVRDTRGQPGALPLLSHCLVETWQRREGRTLTVEAYAASGGVHGAVAQTAEGLYRSLPQDQKDGIHDLLLRLVTPGPEGQSIRARVPRPVAASG
ncbi:MAG: BTAD domain-containing putative transcriptional regulator, partial [Nocardioides sp.]